MLNYAARRIFGTRNDRILKSLKPLVISVNDFEKKMKPLSDDQLRKQTEVFKERYAQGESLDTLLPEAFAVVREGSKRALGMRHFDVQLIGGMVLHSGKISEMKTGEGKTLVATLPAYLNALTGKGVHIVTVNDYLARRDAEWMGRLYNFLGLSVGCVLHGLNEEQKKAAYHSDITYGQNNEFGFDYLRDNMKVSAQDQFQRGHHYAIVDEVDSILIDEARTPLIISGPAEESTELYSKINKIIPYLKKDEHFEIDLRSKTPTLNDLGVAKTEQLLEIENLFDPNNIETLHHVNQALRAHSMMERDVDYVVKDGQIIIVDEFTGRLMPGRRWSNGLHQAIEAKEGVKIARENQTLASITFQNYFRQYEKLSGMTGTADTEAAEFQSIYKLETVVIPTNQIMIRADESDQVFRNKKDKYEAVVEEIKRANETGQPILAGTISIDQSERLSMMLKERGVAHNVLNAKHHEREAEIVAQAGRYKAVTIATNMAGRGTDIVLGGNPEFLAAAEAGTKDPNEPAFQEALKKYTRVCAEEREKVVAAGGLYIIGTERHESRRIDNQLRGRAGRQGDPGRSRFYISLEDDLMLRFGGEKMKVLMARFGWEEGLAIDGRLISRSIESAQKKVEAFHFEMRKHVTEYDDVMNKQRQVIYNLRTKILMQEAIRGEIEEMVVDAVEDAVLTYCDERAKPVSWDLDKLKERFQFLFNAPLKLPTDLKLDQQLIFDEVKEIALKLYQRHVAVQGEKLSSLKSRFGDAGELVLGMSAGEERAFNFEFAALERNFFFETLDHFWNRHLQAMDELREGIGLRGWGQKNPLHEYQREGFLMFQQMIAEMKETIVRKIFFFDSSEFEEVLKHFEEEMRRREEVMKQMQMVHESTLEPGAVEGKDQGPQVIKGPEDQRARLEAQRRERRKQRR